MTPADYNGREIGRGNLSLERVYRMAEEAGICTGPVEREILRLLQDVYSDSQGVEIASRIIEVWQSTVGLVDDGMFGPRSQARYCELYESAELSPIAIEMLRVAHEQIGRGEEHVNNAGEFVHMLRDFPYGDDYQRPVGNWCAFFVTWCLRQACERLQRSLPFPVMFYDKRFGKQMPIGSARRVVERAAEVGKRVDRLRDTEPGDLIAFWRGSRGSRWGHIAIRDFEDRVDGVYTIEGNAGESDTTNPPGLSIVRQDFVPYDHRRFLFAARLLP